MLDGLLDALAREAGLSIRAEGCTRLGAGFSERFRIESSSGPVFVKTASPDGLSMLEAEAEGLAALRAADAVAVPRVHTVGATADAAYLALEWIELSGRSAAAEARLGRELARQHGCRRERHGWHRSNTIGSTPQLNPPTDDWTRFFRDWRLGVQLELAARNGLDARSVELGAQLTDGLDEYLAGHAPAASLLHGDLWGGNWGATAAGVPYLYDPAVYFGDREADLAMTRLFGGFGPAFYSAYEDAWPLPDGWERRVDLYNLYHLLNHFNLFGAGYRSQVTAVLTRLTAALRR
jgi:protein-ribulosamine 3-kinase